LRDEHPEEYEQFVAQERAKAKERAEADPEAGMKDFEAFAAALKERKAF